MDTNLLIGAIIFATLLAGVLGWLLIRQRRQLKAASRPADTGRPPAHSPLTYSTDTFSGHDPSHSHYTPSPHSTGTHSDTDIPSRQLQLQAYERLILLTDRIALPNLIQRAHQPGLSAREMQALLTLSIRQEFEHNITQQIYVSPEAWEAVRNYKDQNTLIVNQVGSFLPEEATGNDLNRQLLDMLMQNPKASLQNVVSEVLSYEAKKLL
jgi:hypothetical protein